MQRANIHNLEARPSTFTSLKVAKLTKEGHRQVQRANIHSLEARESTFNRLKVAKLTKEGHRQVQVRGPTSTIWRPDQAHSPA